MQVDYFFPPHSTLLHRHFVPNLTIGPPVVKALRRHLGPDAFLDCHCMVSNPEQVCASGKERGDMI